MRADAQRNRQRLIDATIEVVLEVGGDPPRDAIAHRAGLGIATLYRHFPDQKELLRAVVLHVVDRAIQHGEEALVAAPEGRDALHRYMHAAIDAGLGAVNIIYPLLDDPHWPDRRTAAQSLLDRLVAAAVRSGEITSDITGPEIALATIRFCRPLAIGLDPDDERAIAHHQLDYYLNGLATDHKRMPQK